MVDNSTLPGVGDVYASDDIGGVKHQRVKISAGADGSATDVSTAVPLPVGNYKLDVARGLVANVEGVNKYGRSTNVDTGIDTDIHDGANATDDLDIWVAPTAARIHAIASTSTDDDGSPGGVGARTLRVYGLQTWGTAESNEDITMDGTTPVNTANSYVIIYRMKVLTKGATNTNVGVITATAATDSTVTAQVNAGEGQTQMAIYGVPSTQNLYISNYYISAVKSATALSVEAKLLSNPEPDTELINFLTKHTFGIVTDGTTKHQHFFDPYYKIEGPAIVKVQGNSSANNTDCSAGFDGYIVTE